MSSDGRLLPELRPRVLSVDQTDGAVKVVFTRDHDVIKRWATARQAEPATGEVTDSGPATVNVNDGGAGIRFIFPGTSTNSAHAACSYSPCRLELDVEVPIRRWSRSARQVHHCNAAEWP